MLGSFSPLYMGSSKAKQTPDPYINNVILSMSMEDTGDGFSVVDDSIFKNVITRFGNPVFSTTQKKFGKASLYFDGTGDYYTSPNSSVYNMPGDYTMEFWMCRDHQIGAAAWSIFDFRGNNENYEPVIRLNLNGSLEIMIAGKSVGLGPIINPYQWYHVSYSRKAGKHYWHLDGVKIGSGLVESTSYGSMTLTMGSYVDQRNTSGNYHYRGWLDDFRWWKDIAFRDEASSFTPPKAPWQSIPPITTIFNPIEILSGGSATEAGYSTPLGWGSISAQPFDGYVIERCTGKKDSTFGIWNNTIRIPGPHSVVEFDRFVKLVPPLRIRRDAVIKNLRPFSRSAAGVIYITSGLDGGEIGFVPGAITILEKVP